MSKPTKQDLASLYKSAVEQVLGLVAKVDDDGDVIFKHPDMGTFFFSLDAEHDPEYMRLVFPNFADTDQTGGDAGRLVQVANEVNRKNKAVKLYVRDVDGQPNMSAVIECFVAGSDQAPTQEFLNAVIGRIFSALQAGVMQAAKTLQGEAI